MQKLPIQVTNMHLLLKLQKFAIGCKTPLHGGGTGKGVAGRRGGWGGRGRRGTDRPSNNNLANNNF